MLVAFMRERKPACAYGTMLMACIPNWHLPFASGHTGFKTGVFTAGHWPRPQCGCAPFRGCIPKSLIASCSRVALLER